MAIHFFDNEILVQSGPINARIINDAQPEILAENHSDIPTSADLTGVELRLLPPFIKNNRTPQVLFIPGLAKLYCLTIVVSDIDNQLVGGIDLQGFPRIGDKEYLPINKTIFYWQQSENSPKHPSQVHVMCSVMKSKEGLRDTGKILASIKSDDDYKNLITELTGLVANASPVGTIVNVITSLTTVVGKFLEDVENKPLGTIVSSFTALDGSFDKAGVTRSLFASKNVNFEFSLIVRDKNRAEASAADFIRNPNDAVIEIEKVATELSSF